MSKVPKFFKSNPEKTLALLLGVVILSLGVVFVTFAWTPPSDSPPGGDISAPLNVSNTAQVKAGRLGIMTDLSGTGYDSDYALSIGDSGDSKDGLKVSGTTTIDQGNLDMSGKDIVNVDKITTNTVDPVYKIGEKKYATYMIDFVGLNAEMAGEAKLNNGEKIFDLTDQEKGSDLWLFWNIVKKDSIKPFVTPRGPANLYAKIENDKLIIKSMEENKETKFSYRLIGTRIDYDKESNLYSDQNVENYINTNK